MSATYAPATVGERRISLSRGPALILGTILLAAGLYFLYRSHTYPRFANFPNGNAPVERDAFFGVFGINGWTGMLTAIAGGLLLFGAAEHFLSKGMSLFVACCLGAAAIIAAISGNVLGLAAANLWTKIGWGAAAVILLLNALMPARRRAIAPAAAGAGVAGGAATGAAYGAHRGRVAEEEPVGAAPATTVGTGPGTTAGTAPAATTAGAATAPANPAGTAPANTAGTPPATTAGNGAAAQDQPVNYTRRITGSGQPAAEEEAATPQRRGLVSTLLHPRR